MTQKKVNNYVSGLQDTVYVIITKNFFEFSREKFSNAEVNSDPIRSLK